MLTLYELEGSIKNALDELGYGISYEFESCEEYEGLRVKIVFDYNDFDNDVPDYWEEDVEDALDHLTEALTPLRLYSAVSAR